VCRVRAFVLVTGALAGLLAFLACTAEPTDGEGGDLPGDRGPAIADDGSTPRDGGRRDAAEPADADAATRDSD